MISSRLSALNTTWWHPNIRLSYNWLLAPLRRRTKNHIKLIWLKESSGLLPWPQSLSSLGLRWKPVNHPWFTLFPCLPYLLHKKVPLPSLQSIPLAPLFLSSTIASPDASHHHLSWTLYRFPVGPCAFSAALYHHSPWGILNDAVHQSTHCSSA